MIRTITVVIMITIDDRNENKTDDNYDSDENDDENDIG